jgi:hypothetical protein
MIREAKSRVGKEYGEREGNNDTNGIKEKRKQIIFVCYPRRVMPLHR